MAEDNLTGDEKIIAEAIKRFASAVESESENRELALDDINFRHGNQWDETDKAQRGVEGRPCLTINKLEQRVDQVTGDQRMNRMGAVIRPLNVTESNGNFKTAEIYSGIIKNIEAVSNAKGAYDTAFDHAVGHGFGFWRIITEYSEDDTFDQDIKIKRINNSMRVYLDPSAEEVTKKDAMWGFVTSMVDKEDYPNADWDMGRGEDRAIWSEGDKVRIAEYFRKVPETVILWRIEGKTIKVKDSKVDIRDELRAEGVEPEKERIVESHKVEWFKMSMNEIFEKNDFPSRFIPIVPCYGKELNVRGKTYYRGVIRYAKDPQRIYNYTRTASIEQTALAPKAPFIMEEEQVGNHAKLWQSANKKNHPVLLYKNVPGVTPPMRQPPPQPSSGWLAEASISDQDIDAASGMYKASLGAPSNERSGKAINARKIEGDVGTYHFHDNRALSLQHSYEILVDMIPRIYDTERVVRIKTPEDQEEMIEINKTITDKNTGEIVKVYDLSQGKYDVAVDVGASYTTQRQMASESMMELIQYAPQLAPMLLDLIAKNLDWSGADEIALRLKNQKQEISPEQVEQAVQEALAKSGDEIKKFDSKTKRLKALGDIQDADDRLEVDLIRIMKDTDASDTQVQFKIHELVQGIRENEATERLAQEEQRQAQEQPVQPAQPMPQG